MEIVEDNIENQLEEENIVDFTNTTKRYTKNRILDSDSETEDSTFSKTIPTQQVENEVEKNSNLLHKSSEINKTKRLAIIDSDSEDDTNKQNSYSGNKSDLQSPELSDSGSRNHTRSDSEDVIDEQDITPHNKSFPDEETAVEAVIYTTNNKGELIKENAPTTSKSLSVLCDPESEEETENNIIEGSFDHVIQPKVYKRQRKKKNEEKPTTMTAQEAAKQRTEIQSESQRMLRESNVSLPYHIPKTYTIKEFLQKRSKLASALPLFPKAPSSVAIKMSKEQLKEVSKKLDERIKEVEEFYKSESEEEDEDNPTKEIESWIYGLVDTAIDTVEAKNVEIPDDIEVSIEEIKEKSVEISKESIDYEFSLDDINETETTKKSSLAELIKDKLAIQPKLSGTLDDIIDLEQGVTKLSGVRQLVEKFLQHTAKKTQHKHKVQLNVVEVVSTGKIVQETVSMNVDDEEEEPALVETPGAKLKKLKEELQVQIAQKRMELWKQKQEQGDVFTVEKKVDAEDDNTEKDILDDEEEEFEMTESESEEDEEEEYEKPEKFKPKSAFIDEEAAEDEEEPEDAEDMEVDEDNEINNVEQTEEIDEPRPEEQSPQKKVLRRIIKRFSVDSDDEEEQSPIKESVFKYYTTDDDDFLPPNLPKEGKTPQRTQIDKNKSEFEFLTPVTYLTGIQNLNTSSKLLNSPNSPQILSNPFGSQDSNFESQVSKTLFPESSEELQESPSTQENLEELAQLCSGQFPESQIEKKSLETEALEESEELPSTQDLINLCSGDFPSMTSSSNTKQKTSPVLTTQKSIQIPFNLNKEIKHLDEEQDQIISQLLDEDDLERFKKKFESPLNTSIRKSQIPLDAEEVNATGLINSDDENEELEVKQKKRKKLVFSDDEEEQDIDEDVEDEEYETEQEELEETIDLQAYDDEEQQLEDEIKQQESRGYKLADFLDKEAELSESEWGSADEDEKDLDELEVELGDQEKFNEKKMRTELERIHMRQILDDDNREVKLLQELLLEDGDMHGTGRKRQFRWKALDLAESGEFEKRDDDDIFLDEEENEEHWRKMRHKREMFLKKKLSSNDTEDDSILSDSQILKLGQQIVKTKSLTSQSSTPVDKSQEDCKEPFSLLTKRGSFLTRKDQVLQRLAEYNKVTEGTGSTVTKNSKSFVFQTVGPNGPVIKDNKRKATENTPNVIKKLRLDDLSPAIGKKIAKSSRAKKLFGNW